jgi:hypothetical protein
MRLPTLELDLDFEESVPYFAAKDLPIIISGFIEFIRKRA